MALVIKKINGRFYYYSFLSYRLLERPKSFSKYIGLIRPTKKKLKDTEDSFKEQLIKKISSTNYSNLLLTKDEVIKSVLFSELFNKKYRHLNALKRRRYDIDRKISFTLTTLTTEEVDVDLTDVQNALEKNSRLTQREQISKNMLRAVDSIKKAHRLDKTYLLALHKLIMASFETKNPGKFRDRQVYLRRKGEFSQSKGIDLSYRPPNQSKVESLLDKFFEWYNKSDLNPIEKAATAHYNLYKIHPFLDGNKRICRLVFNKTLIDNHFPLINISFEKEEYFDSLVISVENSKPEVFVDFSLKQYYKQVKEFLLGYKSSGHNKS